MPPPLSEAWAEAWASAYVQILITLIVFAFGIPALAKQLVVQDEIREVFHRRMRITGWVISLVIIIIAFMAFVWFLHPPLKKAFRPATAKPASADDRTLINLSLIVRTMPEGEPSSTAQNPVDKVGTPVVNPQEPGEEDDVVMGSVASVVMTVIPLVLIAIGFLQTSYLRRNNIIKELEKELLEDFSDHLPPKKGLRNRLTRVRDVAFKKKRQKRNPGASRTARAASDKSAEIPSHALEEETLSDLIYLGQRGKAGKDKELVLDSLDHIALAVQTSPKYEGSELGDLIPGFKDILLSSEQPGNDENFNQVLEIIKGIRLRLAEKEVISKYLDSGLAKTALEELGIEAVKSKSVRTAERFLEEASSSSKIMFQMGLAAISNKHYQTATLALNKLEVLAEAKGLSNCSETFDLLGLIAHFIAAGTATSRRAQQFLSENRHAFVPSIAACLSSADEHHYASSDFDTVDKIFTLRQDFNQA